MTQRKSEGKATFNLALSGGAKFCMGGRIRNTLNQGGEQPTSPNQNRLTNEARRSRWQNISEGRRKTCSGEARTEGTPRDDEDFWEDLGRKGENKGEPVSLSAWRESGL